MQMGIVVAAPRLLQVDGSDPFFQAQVINMSMIRQCYECKLFKSYSWRALQDMLIKVGNNLDYDADKKAHNNFDTSFRKLHSLAKGSFNEFRHFIQPEDPTSKEGDPNFKQDSIEGAGRFIICRIRALKTGADTVSGAAENRANNGFVLIEKRIWETLLCCLMMQQAKFHSDIKFRLSTGTFVDQAQKDSAKMTSYHKGWSLFKNGDLTARESQVAEKTIVKRRHRQRGRPHRGRRRTNDASLILPQLIVFSTT
ncbi:hypothetical protein Pst134EA_026713 [Puccinia striiformis f. sp. tritici]|uniref:hypothetical protein n=1 Tax=Puccinia striiformis f. sp. tritici TaxID=168172 RepID=UPI00200791CB|nr:hypothetical protein Pst134EA_026713 [Puccinia striiformis f. sp. tritici]KAH9450000.1 hypothetical protein Pst134EA_026713 [Puccinia striiformis f. sp. tritici]